MSAGARRSVPRVIGGCDCSRGVSDPPFLPRCPVPGPFRRVAHVPAAATSDSQIGAECTLWSARNGSDCSVRYQTNQSRKIDGVRLRYYIDPSTGEPHIYNHDVDENEVEEILGKPIEDRVGSEVRESRLVRRKLAGTCG